MATPPPPSLHALAHPPEPGLWYRVPAMSYRWHNMPACPELLWPVIGPEHADAEHFNTPALHYHFDARFIGPRHLSSIRRSCGFDRIWHTLLGTVIQGPRIGEAPRAPLPRPRLERMRCERQSVVYPHGHQNAVVGINSEFAGRRARRGRHGWICPHRAVPLGTHLPDAAGVVTCPLHGLRIDAASGVCLGPEPQGAIQ